MASRKTGIVCAVRGCHNNWYKRKIYLEQECFNHRTRTRAECICDVPFDLCPPPKNEEPLRLWLKALNLKKPPKRPYVCSFHFVNTRPTEDHPIPEKWLGYEVPIKTLRRRVRRLADTVFLEICIAQDLPCTVTHEGRRTRYSVPEFNETDCYYQWTNGTKFPLATHETPMDKQVEMKSHQTLLTNVCSEVIYYNRDCLTEGRREATCTTNCSGQVSAVLQTGEAIAHYHWIAPIVVPLLLLGLGLWLGFKNRTFRCGNLFYTSVKTQNNMPDVEERACTL